jgi:hypothetical protein
LNRHGAGEFVGMSIENGGAPGRQRLSRFFVPPQG